MAKTPGPQINPALEKFPRHAALIGRIVLSFGEIEISVCRNAGQALQMLGTFLSTVYKTRATAARIEFSISIIEEICANLNLSKELANCKEMITHCTKVRNQYSHCMWIHDGNKGVGGLFYADPEESYFTPDHIFYHHFRHIDIKLLKSQLNYFVYTIEWLHYLNHEIAWKQGRLAGHNWPRPPILLRPPLHNLPQKHIPPFLTEDQKALFLKHIEAEKTGAQKPTPKQQAQEKERSLKRAKQEEQRKKSREGKPRKNGKPKDES